MNDQTKPAYYWARLAPSHKVHPWVIVAWDGQKISFQGSEISESSVTEWGDLVGPLNSSDRPRGIREVARDVAEMYVRLPAPPSQTHPLPRLSAEAINCLRDVAELEDHGWGDKSLTPPEKELLDQKLVTVALLSEPSVMGYTNVPRTGTLVLTYKGRRMYDSLHPDKMTVLVVDEFVRVSGIPHMLLDTVPVLVNNDVDGFFLRGPDRCELVVLTDHALMALSSCPSDAGEEVAWNALRSGAGKPIKAEDFEGEDLDLASKCLSSWGIRGIRWSTLGRPDIQEQCEEQVEAFQKIVRTLQGDEEDDEDDEEDEDGEIQH